MDWQDLSRLKSSYVCPYNCLQTALFLLLDFFLTFTCKCLPRLQRKVLFKNKCFESCYILHAFYCIC